MFAQPVIESCTIVQLSVAFRKHQGLLEGIPEKDKKVIIDIYHPCASVVNMERLYLCSTGC